MFVAIERILNEVRSIERVKVTMSKRESVGKATTTYIAWGLAMGFEV